MPSTRTSALAAVALLASTEAFVAPGAPAVSRTTRTVMSAERPSAASTVLKTSAVALLAGMLSAGAAFTAPVDAAMFDVASAPATQLQRDVGFGSPEPDSDPTNNNAASGRVNDNKYEAKQQGEFAKKFAQGNAADYGSPKGTDFGPTAGKNKDAASNTKATSGAFQADAQDPANKGVVDIAAKNTKDAANVAVRDIAKTGGNVKASGGGGGGVAQKGAEGLGKAAAAATSGNLKNGFTQSLKANSNNQFTSGGAISDANPVAAAGSKLQEDAAKATSQGSGFLGFGGNKAQKAASKVESKVSSDINTAKSAAQKANPGNWNSPAASVQSSLKGAVSDAKNAAPDVGGAAKSAGNAVASKVASDIDTVKTNTPSGNGDGGLFGVNSQEQAAATGAKTVAKVKDDINAVKGALAN